MTLFFETSTQADLFLKTVLLGLMLACCLDVLNIKSYLSVVVDTVVFCLLAACLILIMIIFQQESLRIYHLLGCMSGSIIYWFGIGKVYKGIVTKINQRKLRACRKIDLC